MISIMRLSPRAIARRLLGRRGTFLLRNIVSEIAFRIGYYEDPRSRPQGITAMVVSYNEEDWVEPSLISIKDLVDEYIVIDSSTDKTPEIIERIKNEYDLDIKFYRVPPGDLSELRNEVLRRSGFRWILHWDPDFVLFDESVEFIRSLTEKLDNRKHYLIYWPWINLCGDIKHLCRNPLHVEHWLFTYSRELVYRKVVINEVPFDSLIAPLRLYKTLYIDKVLGIHLAYVRRPARLALKILWTRYREEFWKALEKELSYEDYAKIKAKEIYGTDDLEDLGRRLIMEMIKDLPEYKGSYPSILRKYISSL